MPLDKHHTKTAWSAAHTGYAEAHRRWQPPLLSFAKRGYVIKIYEREKLDLQKQTNCCHMSQTQEWLKIKQIKSLLLACKDIMCLTSTSCKLGGMAKFFCLCDCSSYEYIAAFQYAHEFQQFSLDITIHIHFKWFCFVGWFFFFRLYFKLCRCQTPLTISHLYISNNVCVFVARFEPFR